MNRSIWAQLLGLFPSLLAICNLANLQAKEEQDKPSDAHTQVAPEERDLVRDYRGKVTIPDTLLKAYAAFVKTAKKPTEEAVAAHCLPQTVRITTYKRATLIPDPTQNINLPFLISEFQAQIVDVRKDNDDCYLIRTPTSVLRWVHTESMGWKLYYYLDEPVDKKK